MAILDHISRLPRIANFSKKKKDDTEYFNQASEWENDVIERHKSQKLIAFVIAGIAIAFAGLCVIALAALSPLKSVDPYLLLVDEITGQVEIVKPMDGTIPIDKQQALNIGRLAQYVIHRETWDYDLYDFNTEFVSLYSEGKAAKEYVRYMEAGNPDSPQNLYGSKKEIRVRVNNVSFLNESTAHVRFTEELHSNDTRIPTNSYAAIIKFRYVDVPKKMKHYFVNPMGFKVYEYRVDQENFDN